MTISGMSGSKLRDTVGFDHAQAGRSSSAANSLDRYTISAPRVDSLQSRQIRTIARSCTSSQLSIGALRPGVKSHRADRFKMGSCLWLAENEGVVPKAQRDRTFVYLGSENYGKLQLVTYCLPRWSLIRLRECSR